MIRLVLIVLLLVVLAVAQKPERSMLWNALYEAGHVPLFAAVAWLVRGMLAERRPAWSHGRTSLAAFGVAVSLGAATELAQAFTPYRDAAWSDLARNVAGVSAALLLWHAWVSGTSPGRGARRRGAWLAAAGVALLGVALLDLADTVGVIAQRARAMPTVVAFDGSRWERRLLLLGRNRLTPVGQAPGAPPGLARLDLRPSLYSGLTINEPYPDWRGRSALVFEVGSDLDRPLQLAIRIHDARHDNRYRDRFNRVFEITPGTQTIRIPLDEVRTAPDRREMDMGRVRGVAFFVHRLQEPAHLFIGPMRLE